jgi:hypothetical protein
MVIRKKIIAIILIVFSYWFVSYILLWNTCIFKNITGLPCPGCGLSRSGLALLSGDIKASLYYHSLLVPIVIFILLAIFGYIKKIKTIYLWLMVLVVFLYYGIRMWLLFPHRPPLDYEENNLIQWLFHQLHRLFV